MRMLTAEIGINHQGDRGLAIEMVKAAKKAGADVVKFQKRDIGAIYSPEELEKPCKSPWGETVRDKVTGRELSWKAYDDIVHECEKLKISFAISCFDFESLIELEDRFGDEIEYHKVPAAMATDFEFLKLVASYRRDTLISTGLCHDLTQIRTVARYFAARNCRYVLMHSTALYPTPARRLNIAVIEELRREFHDEHYCKGIGYSGHDEGIWPTIFAATLGADYIERHFTLDRSGYGGDQSCSLLPDEFKEMGDIIRRIPAALGSRHKKLLGDEKRPETGRS